MIDTIQDTMEIDAINKIVTHYNGLIFREKGLVWKWNDEKDVIYMDIDRIALTTE